MYGKLFESTFTGSLVGAGLNVFGVWCYVIAHAKRPGIVEVNPRLLSPILGCSEGEVRKALDKLCSPDKDSRSKECEGRRLVKVGEFMYEVPNWNKYHSIQNEEERREYFRMKKRESRARKGSSSSKKAGVKLDVLDSQRLSITVNSGQHRSTQAEAEAEAEAEKRKKPAATPPAAVAADVHLKAVGWFAHRFQELRAVKYEITQRDRSETHRLLVKQGVDRSEWARRAERMLNHRVRFHFENASPAHLAEKWNVFALDDSAGPTAVDKKVQEADAALARLNGEARA